MEVKYLTPLSTRLFPKNLGADKYLLSGIASLCDWVITSDMVLPCTHFINHMCKDTPQTVFLSLREPFKAISYFYHGILSRISADYILISGSEDVTVPTQIDKRWRPFNAEERYMIDKIASHSNIIHWYCENLDLMFSPKVSAIPLGMVFPSHVNHRTLIPEVMPIEERSLSILCAHRVWDQGPQWDLRRSITQHFKALALPYVQVLEEEVSECKFNELLSSHAFVVCASGGGLDPCPKAWQALMHGAIPIVKTSLLDVIFSEYPVLIIDDWFHADLSIQYLARQRENISKRFNSREDLIHRLSLDYWWNKITKCLGTEVSS